MLVSSNQSAMLPNPPSVEGRDTHPPRARVHTLASTDARQTRTLARVHTQVKFEVVIGM